MNIELIDENKVLIDLCDDDMERLCIEYATLDSRKNTPVIKTLIEIAKAKAGLTTYPHTKILVDTMPYDGGCFILITLQHPPLLNGKKFRILKKSFARIFVFANSNDMIQAMEKIFCYGHLHCQSYLYLYREHYYLLIESLSGIEKVTIHLLNEYACRNFSQTIKIAHVKEHGTIIVAKNAIEILGSSFS